MKVRPHPCPLLLAASFLALPLVALSPASAHPYQVTLHGTITSQAPAGVFDSTVQVGTPFTTSFTWDTVIPVSGGRHNPPFQNEFYNSNEWMATGTAYGATASFGDYRSAPDRRQQRLS